MTLCVTTFRRALGALLIFSSSAHLLGAPEPSSLEFFEKKVRPLLAERCYECHATGEGKKLKGGLALDTREGARKGGDSGPAVVPGDAKKSLLLEAMRYAKNDLQMPPEKDGGKLSDAVIKDFEKWIQTGAADPRTGGPVAKKEYDGLKAKDHWAYQPVRRPSSGRTIDDFIEAGLEAKGLKMSGPADARTLIRRTYFDVIGLPPTPEEVAAFVADPSDKAYAAMIDRLLDMDFEDDDDMDDDEEDSDDDDAGGDADGSFTSDRPARTCR